jgi:hypothetical protein
MSLRRRLALYRLESRPQPDCQCRRSGVESCRCKRITHKPGVPRSLPPPEARERARTAQRRKCWQWRPGFRTARNGSQRVLRIASSHPFGLRRLARRTNPRHKVARNAAAVTSSSSDLPALSAAPRPRSRLGTPATADYRQRSPAALYASSHRREPGRFDRQSV